MIYSTLRQLSVLTTKLIALLALVGFFVSAHADTWRYTTPFRDATGGQHLINATVNGVRLACLFDSGANAYDAIWLQRKTAQRLGLKRKGSDYHYYTGLTVQVGNYKRTDVVSYEYDAAWNPDDQCLIGDTFFKVNEVLIDKKSKRLFWR